MVQAQCASCLPKASYLELGKMIQIFEISFIVLQHFSLGPQKELINMECPCERSEPPTLAGWMELAAHMNSGSTQRFTKLTTRR